MKVHRPLQFSSTYLPELRDEAVDEDRLAQLPDLRDVVQQAEDLYRAGNSKFNQLCLKLPV